MSNVIAIEHLKRMREGFITDVGVMWNGDKLKLTIELPEPEFEQINRRFARMIGADRPPDYENEHELLELTTDIGTVTFVPFDWHNHRARVLDKELARLEAEKAELVADREELVRRLKDEIGWTDEEIEAELASIRDDDAP